MDEGTEEDIAAMRVIVHPNYSKPNLNNDIALIQLARPATLSARVGTVCLSSQDQVLPTSSRCFVTGAIATENGTAMLIFETGAGCSKAD